ncbi:yeats family-domain-containing protein [Fimicolochytrium jonesii]|uniref:yeats family-domain-containing protein n=1 Tax=Fimicolochytrium jonesii TaxID=1396493 RepID=UPI0022FE5B54|nr:yeats family-domain-containing protein [Fimicolochytrium jonesii]KAI8815783.1 yeats family-domain-containing protein [Fimicolochytrium jonesii]
MVTKPRLKHISHSYPILYGSHATLLKPSEKRNDPTHTHKWTVYVRPLNAADDYTHIIKSVRFKLHESFKPPQRVIDSGPPWEVHETGWGEFDIPIRITMVDTVEKGVVALVHTLQLYPKDDASGTTNASSSSTATSKSVVSEHYDELVFNEPTEDAHRILRAQPASGVPKRVGHSGAHGYTTGVEAEEVRRLREANGKVLGELERERERLVKAEEEVERLKALLGED